MTAALGSLLGYGVSGLGLALAILAYRLLIAEQKIVKPRQKIITAIYVFMVFSLALVGAGLWFEFEKQRIALNGQSPFPDNAPDQTWYDVLKATREKHFGKNAPYKEYTRGILKTGESQDLPMEIQAGYCRSYMVMTKPPAHIEITVTSLQNIIHTPTERENHFAFGRVCAAKSQDPSAVTLRVTMKEGTGPFVAEAYEAQR